MDRSLYSISLVPPVSSLSSGRNAIATGAASPPSLRYTLGSPIHITWTAPARHSPKDWIGLYRVIDVDDRDVTKVASRGHWMPVCPAEYDDGRSSAIVSIKLDGHEANGEVHFSGDTLVWKCGVYEARYHHDGYTHLRFVLIGGENITSWPYRGNLKLSWKTLKFSQMKRYSTISRLSSEIVSPPIQGHEISTIPSILARKNKRRK